MNKDKILGFRVDEDTAKLVKEELKKYNKTFSEWIRDGIKERKK